MAFDKLVDLNLLGRFLSKIKLMTSRKTAAIPFGQVASTSTSTVFTATVDGITELYDGVCMWLRNGVVTSASGFTINVNNLGAKPVYSSLAAATQSTTIFNINYTMLFVYNSSRVSGGCWDVVYGYNSDTNTIGYQLRTNSTTLPVSGACYRYRLLFTSVDGTKYVPANTGTSTNATATRTVNQTPINPFGPIRYYSTTTAVSSGSSPGAAYIWKQYNLTLGYSFNRTGAALTLTSGKPIYIKCAPQADGSAIIDSTTPYVQELPTTEDGKIYIFLGLATAATTMELVSEHPVYYYCNGSIRLWTGTRSNSHINVKDYGAKGDGTTDDTTAITNAINATTIGGTIFIPDGKYKLSDTINIPQWKMLELSGSTELVFSQTSTPCIKINRYGRVKGNFSIITVPYNYTGHAVECFTNNDPVNADEIDYSPFMGATPGWRTMRIVEQLGIRKPRDTNSTQTLVNNLANIGGDAVYIAADNIIGTNVSANSNSQWGTMVNAYVAGGFANGFHVEVVDPSDSWMSDIIISGMTESCETGVLIENVAGGVFCDVIVQPHYATTTPTTTYAKNGIKVVNSVNVDMSRSKIWDWNSTNTKRTGTPPTDPYQAYALIGNCPGAIIHDFGMFNSNNTNENRIYTDNFDNILNAEIIGSKGLLAPPPAYAFWKNFRNGNDEYNRNNVSWRDPQNMRRYHVPVFPSNAYSNPNHLYKIGYFDFGEAENPVSGFADVLSMQTVTIEEVDSRGIYGYTNLNFTTSAAEAFWNPIGYGYGGRIPIYFYSSSGTRRTIYKLVRDQHDIQQVYNCEVSITNARRFVFDWADMGEIDGLSSSTYILLQPKYADGAEICFAGMTGMSNGDPVICTQSAIFGRNGTPSTPSVIKQLAFAEDIPDIAEITSETVPGYTNQVPISTDENGNIYNTVGYKQGYGLNGNGEVVSLSGTYTSYVTGFIPVSAGDVIKIKDPGWKSGFSESLYFAVYDSNKTTGNGVGRTINAIMTYPTNYGTLTVDGDTITWELNGNAYAWRNAAYIRVTTYSADTIVAVNENIQNIVRQYGRVKPDIKVDENNIIINSSTPGSIKRFKISINDSGTITATEVPDE